MELVSNNMGAAIKLGMFAAKNPKIMGLEEGKKVGFAQFQSGFSKELIERQKKRNGPVPKHQKCFY